MNSEASEVLLISRIQGTKGEYKFIQRATKIMNDVAPASFLLAALQGFAEAFGVVEIVRVSARRQSTYNEVYAEVFRKSYDDFFVSVGAVLDRENLFHCPVPIPEKPLQEIKRGHKLRTKEKQAFKRNVADSVRRFFHVNRRAGEIGSCKERESDVPVPLFQ